MEAGRPDAERLYMGIDGGASYARGAIVDGQGELLVELERRGGCNVYLVGIPACIAVVVELFTVLATSGCPGGGEIEALCVSLSGADEPQVRAEITCRLRKQLSNRCSQVFVVEDSLAPLGFTGGRGLVVLAGTGSVARFVDAEQDTRCGGWGHLVSDGGSAFSIATDALRHMVLELEGVRQGDGESYAELWLECKRHFEVSELPEILPHLHGEKFSKAAVASFAERVYQLVRGGSSRAAEAVFERAGRDLGGLARGALRHKKSGDRVSCICAGGVFRGWDALQTSFLDALRSHVYAVHVVDRHPCIGAALLALQRGGVQAKASLISKYSLQSHVL